MLAINQARFVSYSGAVIDLPIQPCPHQMQEEAEAFALAIAHQNQLLILNGYKQLSRSMRPSTRCVKALEYNLRMKKEWKNNFHKAERPVRNTRFDTFTEIQNRSSPLSMKEKMSESVLPVLVRHSLPFLSFCSNSNRRRPNNSWFWL